MDKKSFKAKSTAKKKDLYQEKLDMLEEKYQKIKEILKQVLKDLQHQKEKNEILQKEFSKLEDELKEKDELLEKMQSVSEAVVDEFSTLKAKCEMEAEAANKAIKRATRYFQENLKLKEIQCKEQPELINASNGDDSTVFRKDSIYSDMSELDILNKSNSDLRAEIASLKTQLSKEIENRILLKENFESSKLMYEQEVKEHQCVLEKLRSLEMLHVSFMETEDMNKHLGNGIAGKNNTNQEERIKSLKILECENNNSKLESREENLIATLAVIEQQKEVLQNRVKDLENQISRMKSSELHNVPYIPPPPPPPPPPPSFNPIKSLFTFIYAGRKAPKKPTALPQENTENVHQTAMSEMINAIKKGSIQLKPVPKAVIEKREENIDEPIALAEMRNILKTLRKREGYAKAKETKNEDLSNSISETAKNVNTKLNSKEESTNELNSIDEENLTQLSLKDENNLLLSKLHQEDTSNQKACLGIEVANLTAPFHLENHSKSSFEMENNKLADQNFKNHLDNDFPSVDNISNCSSSSLNGYEFPSYSPSLLEDSKEDFVITI